MFPATLKEEEERKKKTIIKTVQNILYIALI